MAGGVDAAAELRPAKEKEEAVEIRRGPIGLPARLGSILSRSRWLLTRLAVVAVVLFVLGTAVAAWLIKVDATWLVGATSSVPPAVGYDANLEGMSALIELSPEGIVGLPVRDRSIALTFDDGPDPVYTEQILNVLERHGVPGTFFVLGIHVLENPDLTRRIVAAGHELGVHTWNHPRLGDMSPRHVAAQHALTQQVIAGTTGVTTTLARPPFAGDVPSLSDAERQAAGLVDDLGYTVVLADRAPPDYRPGITADEIRLGALPEDGKSAVVMLHDGGGNRTATVAALDALIPQLRADGYEFMTVSEYADLAGPTSAPWHRRLSGIALIRVAGVVDGLSGTVPGVMIGMGALLIFRFAISVGIALWVYRRDRNNVARLDCNLGVSIIVPAYNEAAGIEEAIRSLTVTRHPGALEIIVVDDGSTDGTAEIVERLGDSRTRLIRQSNAGKAVALNTGIEAAIYDIVVLVDADTVFEPTTLDRLIEPFVDPRVGAVSGNPRVANPNRFVTKLQQAEYLLGCALDRRMMGQLGFMWCIPGAVGAFRRAALVETGMVPTDTLAEDTDLTIAIRRRGWNVAFAPSANAYTEVPETWRGLWRQRVRWSYGVMQVNWKTRLRQESDVGWYRPFIAIYLLLMNLLLPLLGPIVDLLGLVNIVLMNYTTLVWVWIILSLVQVAAITVAAALDRVPLRIAIWGPAQLFVYRQFLFWVTLASLQRALLGRWAGWGTVVRVGIKRRRETVTGEPLPRKDAA